MKILLNGARGRMGQVIVALAEVQGDVIAAALDQGETASAAAWQACEVVIDFSTHEATAALVQLAAAHHKPVVIGTTGHDAAETSAILAHQGTIPIVWSGNYSIGVNLLFYLTEQVAATLTNDYHPEIVEMHHRMKKDAPSGTARHLVEAILRGRQWPQTAVRYGRDGITGERPDEEIGVHALRGGEVVGEHTVIFAGPGERLELKHQATDRRIFGQGALAAAQWALGQAPGLYTMQDVLELGGKG
jgi:4-hydroxy-tetrahydrodipicolinate reductase